MKQWTIMGATFGAAIMGLYYIHNFVFTRVEAESLVFQVEKMEVRITKRLDKIENKVDDIYTRISLSTPPKSPKVKSTRRHTLTASISSCFLSQIFAHRQIHLYRN